MTHANYRLLAVWAIRDVMRRPLEAIFIFLALFLLVLATAAPLLLTQALTHTTDRILAQAPAMVIRRVTPGGWAPIPMKEAVAAALSVPGITAAAPRVWGTASAAGRAVTVVGLDNLTGARLKAAVNGPLPMDGQCIVGPDAFEKNPGQWLLQNGRHSLTLTPVAAFERGTGMVVQDIVLTSAADARRLLDIPDDRSSDLAIDVFHSQETSAILPELAAAFPWPVKITPRSEARGSYAAGFSRPSTIWIISLGPALLALSLLVLVSIKERMSTLKEVSLLKALGWTTVDIVSLHLVKALFIAAPAVATGLSGAFFMVFRPGIRWPGYLFFGWSETAPALYLDPSGSGLILAQVAALVVCPYLAAVLWPAAVGARGGSQDLLREGF